MSGVDFPAVWAWALAPVASFHEPRETAFQKVRLIAAADVLAGAAAGFRAAGGWASDVAAAAPPLDQRRQVVLGGTLRQFDDFQRRADRAVADAVGPALTRATAPPPVSTLGGYRFDFGAHVYIAGILNNTPDSFYDRGRFFGLDAALARAEAMIAEGADLIEVGGETAQEGEPLEAGEEIARVVPLVRELSRRADRPIAVDTYKAAVARAAIDAGAVLINDISGMADPAMSEVVARGTAGIVLMHLHGRPKQPYVDVPVPSMMDWVAVHLTRRTDAALDAGIPRERILVDPGLNFGKDPARDLELMRRLPELRSLGFPIFVATSRKDYVRDLLHLHPDDLLEGTAAAVAFAIAQGANMLRVHDVKAMVRVARMMEFFCGHRRVGAPVVSAAEASGPEEASIRGQAER